MYRLRTHSVPIFFLCTLITKHYTYPRSGKASGRGRLGTIGNG